MSWGGKGWGTHMRPCDAEWVVPHHLVVTDWTECATHTFQLHVPPTLLWGSPFSWKSPFYSARHPRSILGLRRPQFQDQVSIHNHFLTSALKRVLRWLFWQHPIKWAGPLSVRKSRTIQASLNVLGPHPQNLPLSKGNPSTHSSLLQGYLMRSGPRESPHSTLLPPTHSPTSLNHTGPPSVRLLFVLSTSPKTFWL